MRRPFVIVAMAAVCVLLSSISAGAQTLYGSAVGTVSDNSGAVIPGATVTLTDQTTGLARTVKTDEGGRYRVLDIPPGAYTLQVSASGFSPQKQTDVTIAVGQINQGDFQLKVGSAQQEVTVAASAAVLQTQKADVHTEISAQAIQQVPLDLYRNFQSLERLVPGAQFDIDLPNSPADTPDRSLGIAFNGSSEHTNVTRVDGATDLFIWLPNHLLIVPPAETIDTVNVQTDDFDIERGEAGGVAVDVVTKSGTNAFHGSAFAYNSNNAIDARYYFDESNQKKPKNILNDDGFTLGGPVIKNKLFFFTSWDRTFQDQASSTLYSVPTAAWKQGNFTSALGNYICASGRTFATSCASNADVAIPVTGTDAKSYDLRAGMVFDPFTGNADGTNRQVFAFGGNPNVIDPALFSGTATAWNKLLPDPNVAGNTSYINDYFAAVVNRFNRNVFDERMDWNRTDTNLIWGKYEAQKFTYNGPAPALGLAGQGTGDSTQLAQIVDAGQTWTISPNMVLTDTMGFSRMSEKSLPPDFGKNYGSDVLGIPGTNVPTNDPRYSGLPGMDFGDYTLATIGDGNSWDPVNRNDWSFTQTHNLSWIHNRHEFKFGTDAVHHHLNHFQPEIRCCLRGYFFAGSGWNTELKTPLAANLSPVNENAFAGYMLGLFNEADQAQQYIKATAKEWEFGFYGGDKWQVTNRLTADLGLRYEVFPLISRDSLGGGIERYDPTTNSVLLGGKGGVPKNAGITVSKKMFAPRMGIAYRIDDKTVLRGGYGITYDPVPLARPLRGWWPMTIGTQFTWPGGADACNPAPQLCNRYTPFGAFNSSVLATNPMAATLYPNLQIGIPLLTQPDISKGVLPMPADQPDIQTPGAGLFKREYIQSWNAIVERKFPGDFLISAGWVGNHATHVLNSYDLNQATFHGGSASQPLCAQFNRCNAYSGWLQGYLDAHYNALQVQVKRQFTRGLYVQGGYTWSKAINLVDDEGWTNALLFNCVGCEAHNRGMAGFNRPQTLSMAFVYDLPFGPNQRWGSSNAVAQKVFGGWQIAGLFTANSGQPLTIYADDLGLNSSSSQTANWDGKVTYLNGTGPNQYWFSPADFSVPQADPTTKLAPFGTSGRNIPVYGPGLLNFDGGLYRHFKVTERFDLQLRGEAQNITNSPHFRPPHTTCSNDSANPGHCLASNFNGAPSQFGTIDASYGERVVKLGLRLTF